MLLKTQNQKNLKKHPMCGLVLDVLSKTQMTKFGVRCVMPEDLALLKMQAQ
jgi:hypothetical protein